MHDAPMSDLIHERFPRSNRYHPDWVRARGSGGGHALWLTEWLCESLQLRPGMRVLDLGCGKAMSSVFLHREFGVDVVAADLWFSDAQNRQCFHDAGVAAGVHAVRAEAHALPFDAESFDAIVCIDAYQYFGTDDTYTHYLTRLLKQGGQIGIAGAGLTREFDGTVPAALQGWWEPIMACLHSHAWWRSHWQRSGVLEGVQTDAMADACQLWLQWQKFAAPDNLAEIRALEADRGEWLTYVRAVARRRAGVMIDPPLTEIPTEYVKTPLLR
jgi:cyclopropane fatty-acyl-phospholipid synthase-like methyltransferase